MKGIRYIFIFFYSLTLTCLGQEVNETKEAWKDQNNLNKQDTTKKPQGSSYGRDFDYRKGKADAFRVFAELERENGNLPAALRYYLSSIYEYEIIGDSNSIANIRLEIGEIFQEGQLYDKALEYYLRAELIFLNEGNIENNVQLLENIAQVYYDKKDYQKSLNYYERIEKIFEGNKQDNKLIATYFNMVKCWNQLGQFEQSLIYNQKILEYYRKTENREQEIICLNNLGYTYKNLGNYEEALDHFEEALKTEKEITGVENPVTLVNIAIVYQNLDKNKRSLEYLHQAAGMVEKLGDNHDAAEYNHLTSVVYFNMKDYYNAQISNREAIRRAKIVHNPAVLEAAYLLSSKIYEALYDYESAMLDYQKYLDIRDSIQRAKAQYQSDLTETAFLVERVSHDAESLWATEEISYLDLQRLKLDSANREQELQLFYQTDSIQRITIANQQLENQRALQELLLKEEQVYAAKKEKEVDSLRQIERIQSL
ncbi:MAG: tetratricopeptide repeat protein, partial [Bacteroidetes bacterium]|nr:tetratricopeptide repeat protein [Bacteroidota bacterium]